MLLLLALAAAPPPTLWVRAPTAEERERARAAGLSWAEGRDGDWLRYVGDPARADAAGLAWRLDADAADGWAPRSDEVAARLRALPAGTLVQIGESVEGRPILGVRFGEGGHAVRVLGGHHGDEGSSVEVALRVAEALAAGAVALPEGTEAWVVPAVNPDGLDAGTRHNARNVDLNRNYGVEWSEGEPYGGDGPFSEPETRAVRALTRARTFHAGLSLHSGATNLGWVWNWSTGVRPVEEPLLAALAEAYAEDTSAPGFWLTNGADWYVTHGDTTDWSYGRWGTYEYTLELTESKSPPEDEVASYVAWHLDAILAWIARAPDATGTVVDALTGEPIPATLSDGDSVQSLTTGPAGAVARFGEAALVAEAPGYAPAALAGETRLAPEGWLDALPEPRLLSRGAGPTRVTIPGVSGGTLTLSQPGEEPVSLAADGDAWTIDPTALAPGAWTLTTEDGAIPRGLFVGEVDDRVALADARLDGAILTVEGANFGPGAEAWSIGGPARALHALPKLSESASALVFLLSEPDDDVLLWVNGAWLSIVDVRATPTVDPDPPAEDTGAPTVAETDTGTLDGGGGCAVAAPAAGTAALAAAALLVGRRARRPNRTSGAIRARER